MDVIFRADPPQRTQIVVGFFINDVNDLVDGQTPHQFANGVHNSGTDEVVTFEGTRRFLRIVLRGEDHRLVFHHLAHLPLGAVEQDGFQLQFAEEGFIPGGDKQLIGVIRHFAQATQIALHGAERHVRAHCDNAELHNRADTVFLVMHHLAHARAFIGRQ